MHYPYYTRNWLINYPKKTKCKINKIGSNSKQCFSNNNNLLLVFNNSTVELTNFRNKQC